MHEDRESRASFSEPEARRILARATELEATVGTRFTAADLREIAAKAGIDAEALERAISETADVIPRPMPANPPASLAAGTVATLAATGAALGLLAIGADNLNILGSSPLPVFAPSAIYTLYRALRHPLGAGIAGLLRELAVVFGSFTLAVIAVAGSQGLAPAAAWSLACGMLGSGVLSIRGARELDPSRTAATEAR